MLPSEIVPTRCEPDDGLSTVNETGDEDPGYRLDPTVACNVTAELEPTVPVPVPDPVVVKYA
jgi:hypothetical protein